MSAELVIAPIGCFVTIALLFVGLFSPKPSARGQLEAYIGPRIAGAELAEPLWRRALLPVTRLSLWAYEIVAPQQALERLRSKLETAGEPIGLGAFITCRFASMLALPVVYGVLLVMSDGPIEPVQLIALACLGLAGSYLPKAWLASNISSRRHAIARALPDALDLVLVSMEAGLALDAALAKVVEKSRGPLANELKKTLSDIALGTPRRLAMRQMGSRVGLPSLTTVTNSIIQADEMGVSMADIMRTQAEDARIRRRQRAEEQAHKAGIKMLFPLICFILPSVLIVALGPAVVIILRQFSSGSFGR